MGAIDICLKNRKHFVTIFIEFEGGEVVEKDFKIREVEYIRGYRDHPFRISIRQKGEIRHFLTSNVDFKEKDGRIVGIIKGKGHLEVPVEDIIEIISHK